VLRVELLNIGTEIMMGFIVNRHAAWLGRQLNQMGAELVRQVAVADRPADIRDAILEALSRCEVLITTGGLGPTSDDLTRDLIAKTLNLPLHEDVDALKNIEERFRRRNLVMPLSARGQALVPEGVTIFQNAHGTAPGFAIPVTMEGAVCRWILVLPGPPRELHPMFENQAKPLLHEKMADCLSPIACRVLHLAGRRESDVADKFESDLSGLEGLEIGYCARPGDLDLRLIVRGESTQERVDLMNRAEARARKLFSTDIYGMDGESLESVVIHRLLEKKIHLATAESCTGGCLSNRLTAIPGCSEIYRGGWITYSNEMKSLQLGVDPHLIEVHGAVSEPVAKAMAEGALSRGNAGIAVSITGIAGPGGGSPEKPVGTVFIGLASKAGPTVVNRFHHAYERETFKFMASHSALNMIRMELL
jgi:nicotinamide-nucleotide amidase